MIIIESWPNINFNLNFKILTKPSFRISTKIKLHNLNQASAANTVQTSASQSRLNFIFKILTKPCAQILNKKSNIWPNFSFHTCTKLSSTSFSAPSWATSTSLSWYLNTPGSHQWSLLNSSQWVSQLVSLVTMILNTAQLQWINASKLDSIHPLTHFIWSGKL